MFNIGVISDTHNFLDPKIPKLFRGVEHILHAGDIGQARIILELENIAPVTAVLGNNDDGTLNCRLSEVVELARRAFLIHHIVVPHALREDLQSLISKHNPQVVVFGHTHQPFCETVNGTLYFNPGYAGKPRFGMERSIAILKCDQQTITPEYFTL